MKATDKDSHLSILKPHERISVNEYEQIVLQNEDHLTIDVRSSNEFEICQLGNSVNIPIKQLLSGKHNEEIISSAKGKENRVYLLCRRGNDSQLAVDYLKRIFKERGLPEPKDIIGGLHSWTKNVDANFPIY
jgi:adenylyltransferase/sulfurtransferase